MFSPYPNKEVVRAEWLSSTGRVILVSLVNNCERHRVECDEGEVENVADILWADLADIAPPPVARKRAGPNLTLIQGEPRKR